MALLQCLRHDSAAYGLMERVAWPDGPVCPHCGARDRVRRLGGSTGPGTWKCYDCRRIFSLRSRTGFHASHLPLHVSLQAVYLLAASRAEFSATALAKVLGVSLRTACQLKQRARDMMPWLAQQLAASPPGPREIAAWAQPAPWQDPPQRAQPGWACERRFERFMDALAEWRQAQPDAAFLLLLKALSSPPQEVAAAPPALADVGLGEDDTVQLELDFGAGAMAGHVPPDGLSRLGAQLPA